MPEAFLYFRCNPLSVCVFTHLSFQGFARLGKLAVACGLEGIEMKVKLYG